MSKPSQRTEDNLHTNITIVDGTQSVRHLVKGPSLTNA